MDDISKQFLNNMVGAAKDENPSDFADAFKDTMNHKLSTRLNSERKLVAASYFSPRGQEQSND